jgi:hypothetical protein
MQRISWEYVQLYSASAASIASSPAVRDIPSSMP